MRRSCLGKRKHLVSAANIGREAEFLHELAQACAIDSTCIHHLRYFSNQQSVVHYAVESRFRTAVKRLLRMHANPNTCDLEGVTPLISALQMFEGTMVQHLLEAGADPDVCNRDGVSAIELCCRDEAMLKLLLLHNADVHANQCGAKALMHADAACIAMLLAAGVDVNCECLDTMMTPLGEAVVAGCKRNVRTLFDSGNLDMNKCYGTSGHTPVHTCVSDGKPAMLELLLQLGAVANVYIVLYLS
jgi:ankyrin repeat protein